MASPEQAVASANVAAMSSLDNHIYNPVLDDNNLLG